MAVITSMIGIQTKGELSAQDYSASETFVKLLGLTYWVPGISNREANCGKRMLKGGG